MTAYMRILDHEDQLPTALCARGAAMASLRGSGSQDQDFSTLIGSG
jgi:hypothetical protein